MSIIEQALDKLEHTQDFDPALEFEDDFDNGSQNKPLNRISKKILVALLALAGTSTFLALQPEEKRSVRQEQDNTESTISLVKNNLFAEDTQQKIAAIKSLYDESSDPANLLESTTKVVKLINRSEDATEQTIITSNQAKTSNANDTDSLDSARKDAMSGNGEQSGMPINKDWIKEGWQWMRKNRQGNALETWERGYSRLENDTGLYMLEIFPYSKKTASGFINKTNDDSSFFVRWPIKKGRHLLKLCKHAPSTDFHCSDKLPTGKELVLKSDLSMAFYIQNSANKQKSKPRATTPTKTRKQKTQNAGDVANLIPQQIRIGNYENAIRLLDKQKVKLANSWEYYYWKSQAYIGLSDLQNAEKSLELGIKKNPENALLFTQKGIIQQEKGDHGSAIELFRRAESMKDAPTNLYLNMGYSAAVTNNLELARRAYYQYLSLTEGQDTNVREQILEYLAQIN